MYPRNDLCSFEYRDKYGPGVNMDAPLSQTPIKVKYKLSNKQILIVLRKRSTGNEGALKLRYGLFLPFIVHTCRFPNKNRQGKYKCTQSDFMKKGKLSSLLDFNLL